MVQTVINGVALAVVAFLCWMLIDVTGTAVEDRALLIVQEAEVIRLTEEVEKHERLTVEYTTAIENLFAYAQQCDREIEKLKGSKF